MSDVLRQHYVKLAQILSVSQETLISFSGSCYQEHLIDLSSKTAITRASSQAGANMLLDLLQTKIELSQEKDYLRVVFELMAKHTALVDVVVEMEAKLAKEENHTAEIHGNETEVMRLVRTDGGMMSSEVGQSDVLKMEEVDHDKRHCDVLPKQKKRGRLPESNLICPLPPVVGYDDEIFLNPPTDLQCPICKFTLRQPHQVTCCGATMCQACAVKTGAEMQCPCCRDTDHSMMVDKKTRGQIMSLKVKCPNADCHWSGELLDLKNHKSKGCPKPIDRDLLESEDSELKQKLVKMPEPLLFLNTGIQCPPFTIMMSNFNNWKEEKDHWFGPAFYSHPGGYKLCLKVRASGQEEGEGTHVSVYAHIMSGENDQKLQWPFRGKVKLQLLNQRADSNHIDGEIDFSNLGKEDAGARVTGGLRVPSGTAAILGKGVVQLVKHKDLNYSPDRGTEYLREDALLICVKEVVVDTQAPITATIGVENALTFTNVAKFELDDFSKQKAKSGIWQKRFYTHTEGYQFMLEVHANGKRPFKGRSISVFTHLMKGNHDDHLKFPYRGIITVRLVNQREDKNHVEYRIKYNEETDPKGKKGGRITTWSPDNLFAGRSYNGWGCPNFVRHEFLSYDADRNTQYLTDNKLEIKISHVDIFSA